MSASANSSDSSAPREIVSVVVGTAGHIDHGKSSLVRRLTGIDPDRLQEEQAREMTIDLGFAPFHLPDGRRVGLIDVPGHERFVKNMVAGATGIDLVVLVVAADDGVMPQTREHLEILTLLGVEAGMVAITKIDLPGVDDELVEILELELEDLLEGTFLAGAPIRALDSLSGRGFEAFQQTLFSLIEARAEAREAARGGAYRQPIQRVFSARGFGTILTGVPLSGEVAPGDKVEVITSTAVLPGRVRGLQAYGATVERARAGHSTAVNVADVDFKQVHRGDTIAAPGVFRAHPMFEARLELLASQSKPLEQRQLVRVHVGTAEVLGEVVLLDATSLDPGERALAQLRLRAPVVALPGDRFVLRRSSPLETLGGGVILGRSRWRLKAFRTWQEMAEPEWAKLGYPEIDYQDAYYYAAPKKKPQLESLDELDPEIKAVYDKLGIPVAEQELLANVKGASNPKAEKKIAVDAVFDSVSVATTFREELKKAGVIFLSISEAIRESLDRRIAQLQALRDNLDGCIGCGCLSLKTCKLYNPDDIAAEGGPGPRVLR